MNENEAELQPGETRIIFYLSYKEAELIKRCIRYLLNQKRDTGKPKDMTDEIKKQMTDIEFRLDQYFGEEF